MRRITAFLTVIVVLGGAFVSYWIYARYFAKPVSAPVTYQVQRGSLKELLRARGEVAAEREYDLAFESFGTVAEVAVAEGQAVTKGQLLMRLESTEFSLELSRLYAERLQAQAALHGAEAQRAEAAASLDAAVALLRELQRGTRPEEIQVQQGKVDAARVALANAASAVLDACRAAFTSADDAVRTAADQMFVNPRTNPRLAFLVPDDGLIRSIEIQRSSLEGTLTDWQASLALATSATAASSASTAQADLDATAAFLDSLALALNGAIATGETTDATITAWKADVSAARAGVDASAKVLTAAESARRAAEADLGVAQDQLTVLQAGTSAEQIAAQEAAVREAQARLSTVNADVEQARAAIAVTDADIALTRDKIRKASLYAPADAVVTKLWLKKDEQYQQSLQGQPAVSLATVGIKVQADISELDIPKVSSGEDQPVTIVFDAFPDRTYAGRVVSIEPKEIVKDNDTFYRVNVVLDRADPDLRRGMSGDLVVDIAEKTDVLKVPLFMVTEEGGKSFVFVQTGRTPTRLEVVTGISDGDYVEIVSGLSGGETLVAPTD